jgi:hypothetical protein
MTPTVSKSSSECADARSARLEQEERMCGSKQLVNQADRFKTLPGEIVSRSL